jgi:hypothetical protein
MRFIGRLQLLVSAERSTVRCGPRDLVAADHPLVRSQTAPSKSAMGSTGFSWGVRREHGWSFAWACLILSSARHSAYISRDLTAPHRHFSTLESQQHPSLTNFNMSISAEAWAQISKQPLAAPPPVSCPLPSAKQSL